MSALAEYTRLLAHLESTPAEEKEKLVSEAKALLTRLAELDGDRRERYVDLARRLE